MLYVILYVLGFFVNAILLRKLGPKVNWDAQTDDEAGMVVLVCFGHLFWPISLAVLFSYGLVKLAWAIADSFSVSVKK